MMPAVATKRTIRTGPGRADTGRPPACSGPFPIRATAHNTNASNTPAKSLVNRICFVHWTPLGPIWFRGANARLPQGALTCMIMAIRIVQVDAFTDKAFAGNPAAVCVLQNAPDEQWMKDVAREMNLSETAF